MTPKHTDDGKHESNYDRNLQPGDVSRDMWSGKKLFVTGIAAESVEAWNAKQSDGSKNMLDYEGSIATGATESDTVFTCVYLKSNSSFSAGKKSYDYPRSRLARFAHESANGDDLRVQDRIRAEAFAEVVDCFPAEDRFREMLFTAIEQSYGIELANLTDGIRRSKKYD